MPSITSTCRSDIATECHSLQFHSPPRRSSSPTMEASSSKYSSALSGLVSAATEAETLRIGSQYSRLA
ncbi:hypothetical protein DTO027I6_9469 [Penicillium roqueforti]|uniref:uncharacterized protein n=1 Tax=Penicillium roqueforti TaxID=5082 RepID=UPI00190C880C|nr:uncharacterized protein LCP9604111_3863 [Penicillium roqueforti]KAF9249763.1 hypothetical protein LCP9604111_3863 [Penicillium roqueforti]KAI1829851.1 hypothetical protein CBS147337_9358 [Penicillium roqueforti]KAI3121690.1 hypothetical protein CBS147330_7800 [Penicillium roqueforti]KAI3160873.1 hypothetical protein DTO039G3_8895 [Penicillium roqueforti]KAI3186351.1 hypothetical protein DTO027I6_9469 [Penicillium roqueforti]